MPSSVIKENGTYFATIQLLNSDNTLIGEESNIISFTCIIPPIVLLDINSQNYVINGSSCTANLSFSHDIETMRKYKFFLLDRNGDVIKETRWLSNYDSTIYVSKSFTYTMLENDIVYKFYAKVETQNGFIFETNEIIAKTSFKVIENLSTFEVTNYHKKGYVECVCNENIILSNKNKDSYRFVGAAIDLRDDAIIYSSGINLDDFSFGIELSTFNRNSVLLEITGTEKTMILSTSDYEGKIYFKLSVGEGVTTYSLFSDLFDPDIVYIIWIDKNENLYNLDCYPVTDF